jgi:ABC-type multidrug transport system permease subunit
MKKPNIRKAVTRCRDGVKYCREKRVFGKIFFEIYKNFKLIFRNWSSLLLIILAPLFLILLVGYSFSADTLHGIGIGITSTESMDLTDFAENVSSFAEIQEYDKIRDCVVDMALEKNHICLEITGSFTVRKGEIPTGEVKFYYDNTRKQTTLLLLTEMKDYFGLTSEKISLISTQEIFDNLQNLLIFIEDRLDDIDDVKEQSQQIKSDLKERKVQLIDVRNKFTPRYQQVKSAQTQIQVYQNSLNQSSQSMFQAIESLKGPLNDIKSDNTTSVALLLAISQLETSIDSLSYTTNLTIQQINNVTAQIDEVVGELDAINKLLNDEIERTDKYIELIDDSVKKIESTATEARQKMEDFSRLDPSFASRLVKPITQSFEPLVKDVKDVQLAFPMLLTVVIIFISMLFSNMIALLEIHNRAYIRNILAPVNDFIYTSGMALTSFIVISAQVAVLLVLAQTRFGVEIVSRIWSVVPIVAVLIFVFIFIGMTVAYISKNMETSILLSTVLALGFFLFSNALNALEAMPVIAAYVAFFNPVVAVNSMFRMIFFFNVSLSQMPYHLILMIFYLLGTCYLLIKVSKKKNRQRL